MVFSLDTTKTTNTTSAADPSYSTLQETSNYSNRNNSTSRKSCIPSSYSTAEITTMYRSPGRASTPHKPPLPNGGPIADFCAVIESTPADQWQLRSAALRKVVDSIPEGAAYAEIGDAWYNSPPILRHLSIPVGELLKDARSTVVKRTCESLTRLFLKCQSDARYLFKDIMPVILSVHAQTVQVIRTAVQEMVLEIIPEVPCKMVMPLWMERLKVDKSRTVREACALYLGKSLQSWTEVGYLTEEIWMQVGTTLLRTLRDPSPAARSQAKQALEHFRNEQPELFDRLANDPDGPAGKDPKLQRLLQTLGQTGKSLEDAADELSVASKFSYNSESRFRMATAASSNNSLGGGGGGGGFGRNGGASSPGSRRLFGGSNQYLTSSASPRASPVPISINFVTSNNDPPKSNKKPVLSAKKPMLHTNNSNYNNNNRQGPFQQVTMETPPRPVVAVTNTTPPRHPPTPTTSGSSQKKTSPASSSVYLNTIDDATSEHNSDADIVESNSFPSDLQSAFHKTAAVVAEEPAMDVDMDAQVSKTTTIAETKPPPTPASYDISACKSDEDGPFIASMHELKLHASQRRSRNSVLMAQRFRISGSFNEMGNNKEGSASKEEEGENDAPHDVNPIIVIDEGYEEDKPSSASAPEHMVIAIRLLRAHKEHVDHIMETLKIEMDTLRDFDKLLEQAGRPLEDEVLDYFESVGLCLDQRTQAGVALQKEMDRISRGEPPQE
jgi:hypothetical protein